MGAEAAHEGQTLEKPPKRQIYLSHYLFGRRKEKDREWVLFREQSNSLVTRQIKRPSHSGKFA